MAGIVFLQTEELQRICDFYTDRLGLAMWLDQGGCRILRHGNMLIGFCTVTGTGTSGAGSDAAGLNRTGCADTTGVITFFYPTREHVDRAFRELSDVAVSQPKANDSYKIYHFYAKDPEGRDIEFQCFEHSIDWEFLSEG